MSTSDILVIDDDRDLRETLSDLLSLAGHRVFEADNGVRALDLLREHAFPLVFCDISMPGLNGFDVVARARECGFMPAVVMLTAHSERERIVQSLRLGAVDYLIKPFDPKRLIERVPIWIEIGKRLQIVAGSTVNERDEELRAHLRLVELFRVRNHRMGNGE